MSFPLGLAMVLAPGYVAMISMMYHPSRNYMAGFCVHIVWHRNLRERDFEPLVIVLCGEPGQARREVTILHPFHYYPPRPDIYFEELFVVS